MNVLFLTIEHTGSRFFLDLVKPILGEPGKFSEAHQFHHHHTIASMRPQFEEYLQKGYQLWTTQRPYSDTYASWLRRHGHDRDALFIERVIEWEEFIRPNADFIFNLDPDLREESLWELNGKFALQGSPGALTTDWTPIGHYE